MSSVMFRLIPLTRHIQYATLHVSRKCHTSALYVVGDKAQETYSVLTPHIDIGQRYQDLAKLHKNITDRGMTLDVNALKKMWDVFVVEERKKLALESRRQDVAVKMQGLLDKSDEQTRERLRAEGRKLREDLKAIIRSIWDLQNKAVIGGLRLPNEIHPFTPVTNEEKIVHEFGSKPSTPQNENHLQIAHRLGLVEYFDSSFYFLKNDAATFELGLSYFFLDKFCDGGFIQMSNSDFGRSVTVEGVGLDPRDATSVFVLERDNDNVSSADHLHLVGGASLVSFCSYHAKTITLSSALPVRYVTLGRHYSPSTNDNKAHGLFSTWQTSAVETFVGTADCDQAMSEFQLVYDMLVSTYSSLGYHFRVEYLPARSLKPWESLRASFQMFSPNLQKYVEVGNVSLCDDYISKRLLMCCAESGKGPQKFLHVVAGTLVSVPHVLGCVLESDADHFSVPSLINKGLKRDG